MTRIPLLMTALFIWTAPALAEPPVVSAPPPLSQQVQNGIPFMSGGVGDTELEKLLERSDDYNLRVALTRPDGAYLSGVDIAVLDASGKKLVETRTAGPFLLTRLAPGRYSIEARMDGRQMERRTLDIPKEGDQVRIYVSMPAAESETHSNASR